MTDTLFLNKQSQTQETLDLSSTSKRNAHVVDQAADTKHRDNASTVAILLSDQRKSSSNVSRGWKLLQLFQSKKHHKNAKKESNTSANIKTARSLDVKPSRKSEVPRKVTFNPTVEGSVEGLKATQRQGGNRANTTGATDYGQQCNDKVKQNLARRASFDDSIGPNGHLHAKARRSSLGWDKHGIHIVTTTREVEKGRISKSHIAKQAAIANEHALALEQIIHAGASLQVNSLEELKAEREEKTRGKRDKEKLQMIPPVSPKRVQALKKALLDTKTAVGVMHELQRLQVKDEKATIAEKLMPSETKAVDPIKKMPVDQSRKMSNYPVKAVCLDCTEEEAEKRQQKTAVNLVRAAKTDVTLTATSSPERVKDAEMEQASSSPMPSLLTGISPVTLLATPTNAAIEAVQVGTFDALATLSGVAVRVADSNSDHTEEVHPPLDRMAAFIRWWGYEITLPPPSLHYLGTARSVSSALFTILTTMAITGGIPELLPFIRYLSSFVDMEFTAIRSQDKGNGVILAATWLMPMALVPRPWDYPAPSDPSLATPTLPECTPIIPGLITHFNEEPKEITVQA